MEAVCFMHHHPPPIKGTSDIVTNLVGCSPLRASTAIIITSLFTKSLWPRDSEGTFQSSSQAAACSYVYHNGWDFTFLFNGVVPTLKFFCLIHRESNLILLFQLQTLNLLDHRPKSTVTANQSLDVLYLFYLQFYTDNGNLEDFKSI